MTVIMRERDDAGGNAVSTGIPCSRIAAANTHATELERNANVFAAVPNITSQSVMQHKGKILNEHNRALSHNRVIEVFGNTRDLGGASGFKINIDIGFQIFCTSLRPRIPVSSCTVKIP